VIEDTEAIESGSWMAGEMENVYCFQLGNSDCFKVGRTKNSPEDRRRAFSTGSSESLKLYRTVETEYASELEKYIHQLLDAKRAENGEFFHVTAQELDLAIEDARAFVEKVQPVIYQAEQLRKESRLNEVMVEPCDEIFQVYQRLRKVRRDRYLIEQEIAFLESTIQVAIGRNAAMRGVASWRWQDRYTIDTERFREEQNELYQRYKRSSGSRRFCLERIDLSKAGCPILGACSAAGSGINLKRQRWGF